MLENPNPKIFKTIDSQTKYDEIKNLKGGESTATSDEGFDALEIFEMIRHITDPEHPYTLEQLNVVALENISVDDKASHIKITFTPTIPHCSMASLIGLTLRVKLLRSLPERFKVDILITPGSHNQEKALNKQLNDKERVAAAMENAQILDVINRGIKSSDYLE